MRPSASKRKARGRLTVWTDRLFAFDLGLGQMLTAFGVIAGIAASIGAVYVFAQLAHPMWIEPPAGAALTPAMLVKLGLQHHGETLTLMLLSGVIALVSALGVTERKPRPLGLTMMLLPIPMLATIAIAVQLVGHQALGITVLAVVMGVAVLAGKLAPRFGARAIIYGQMLFAGYLGGFLSNGELKLRDLGWLAAALWLAVAVNYAVKLLVINPLSQGTARRVVRTTVVRAARVLDTAAALLAGDPPTPERSGQRMQRQLADLNEAALVSDGQPVETPAVASARHRAVFDAERAVQNVARLIQTLSDEALTAPLRTAITACLREAGDPRGAMAMNDLDVVQREADEARQRDDRVRAGQLDSLAHFLLRWRESAHELLIPSTTENPDDIEFKSPVRLLAGNLPGSALITASAGAAAMPPGSLRARLRLDAITQSAIRVMIAVGAAGAIGSVVSERRYYWAVLAVFVAFTGTNTGGEQFTKAIERVAGTVFGIFVGSLLAHLVGYSSWSIPIIITAFAVGVSFNRTRYALQVTAITIAVSQLYEQLGEFSDHLLLMRLAETSIGAGLAALAALLIFPVDTRQIALTAARQYNDRLGDLLDRLRGHVAHGSDDRLALSQASRALDNASQQLRASAAPLSHTWPHRSQVRRYLNVIDQVSHRAGNAAAEVEQTPEFSPAAQDTMGSVLRRLDRLVEGDSDAGGMPATNASQTSRPSPIQINTNRPVAGLRAATEDPSSTEQAFLVNLDHLAEALAELTNAGVSVQPRGNTKVKRDERA